MPPSDEAVLKATGRSWRQWRTLPFPAPRVWELLLSPRGLAIWLGRTGRLRLAKGARQLFAPELAAAGLGEAFNSCAARARWKSSLERIARMLPG